MLAFSRGARSPQHSPDQHRRAIQSCRLALPQPPSIKGRPRASKKSPICPRRIEAISKSPTTDALIPRIPPGNHTTPAAFGRLSLFSRRRSALFYFHSPPQHVANLGAAEHLSKTPSTLRPSRRRDKPRPHPLRVAVRTRARTGPSSASLPSPNCRLCFRTRQAPAFRPSFVGAPASDIPTGFHNPSIATAVYQICPAIAVALSN